MKNSPLQSNEGFIQIYHRHVDMVYRICFIYMKNKYDTEDMVQNTFIRLMNHDITFENYEHEKAWLIRTATNLCKDHFKSWWKKRVRINNNVSDKRQETFVIDGTLKKVLSLPPKYKAVIYMYYYEGYSTVDIAHILNKNESTIRGQLLTARKRLKAMIERESEQ